MKEMIKELVQYRHLLYMLTWRDIKIKYKQSIMGFLWAIFMPMMIVAAGIVVKKAFSILSGTPMELGQIASVSVKAIPWAFFVGSIRFATNSLTGNMNLVTKIYFPREVFPISATFANLFDFAVASMVLIVLLSFAQIGISIHLIWVPVLMFLLILITIGMGMFFSCANLFFRDIKYIVEVILTFGIFFTPVFYEAKMFGKWETLLLLNPIGSILESINTVVVLHQAPNLHWVGYATIWAIGGLLLAWTIFHKAEYTFAENI
jgi:ABC-type polysaccharide/polyol phosphate export permease